MSLEKILTIGVYGFDEESFFRALREAGVDVLVDVRYRRGLRGAAYAFANSRRLQQWLAEEGIGYVHLRQFAPTPEVRAVQQAADRASGTRKRSRVVMSPAFRDAYRRRILAGRSLAELERALPPAARRIVLLCVERSPAACHRSELANWLVERYRSRGQDPPPVEHLVPPPPG